MNSRTVRSSLLNSKFWFFVVCAVILVSNASAICVSINPDVWFSIRQGEDMLQNGLVTYYDNLSIHDGLPFTNQRIFVCFLAYYVNMFFGQAGIFVVNIFLNSAFWILMYALLWRADPSESKMHSSLFSIILFFALYHFSAYRASVFFAFLLVALWYITEKFIRNEFKSVWIYYGLCFVIGIAGIWIQSSTCFLFFIVLMPYLFDFRFLHIGIFKGDKNFYNNAKIWGAVIFLFLGTLLNPYGIDIYDYVYRCLTVTVHCPSVATMSGEMRAQFATMPNCFCYLLCILNIYFMYVYNRVNLRACYYVAGSLLMSLMAYRLIYIAVIFLSFSLYITLRGGVVLKKDSLFEFVSGRKIVLLYLGTFVINAVLGVFGAMMNFPEAGHCGIDKIFENNESKQLRIFTDFDDGSYVLYKGGRSYVDNRMEFFDDDFYGYDKDLIIEFLLLQKKGCYKDFSYDKDGNNFLTAFQTDYNFDYYVFTKRNDSGDDDYADMIAVLDDIGYLNYEGEDVLVYSFSDDRSFV